MEATTTTKTEAEKVIDYYNKIISAQKSNDTSVVTLKCFEVIYYDDNTSHDPLVNIAAFAKYSTYFTLENAMVKREGTRGDTIEIFDQKPTISLLNYLIHSAVSTEKKTL
jgi:hypothetical protein